MFNVLPENLKEIIKSQYKKRRFITWLAVCITLQIFFLIFMFPAYVYSVNEERNVRAETFSIANSTGTNNATSTHVFDVVNKQVAVLLNVTGTHTVDFLISRLISLKGSFIKITDITYKQNTTADTSSLLTVTGIATNREALLSFSKNIEADTVFTHVDLPVSSFAKDTNINFSMTIQIAQ